MVAISIAGLERAGEIPGLMMPIIIICFKPKLTCRQFRFTRSVELQQPVDDNKNLPKVKGNFASLCLVFSYSTSPLIKPMNPL